MPLQTVETTVNTGVPVFQRILETAQGGFTLDDDTLTAGATVKAGTPIGYDESTRVAKVMKVAEMQATATNSATTYRVLKGHQLKVGDYLAKIAGSAAYAITAIDTSNAAYDEVTLATTLGVAMAVGDVLFQSSAIGASAAAASVTVRGLLMNDTVVADGEAIAVVIRGTVYERRVPKANAAIKALMPNIIYSQSF